MLTSYDTYEEYEEKEYDDFGDRIPKPPGKWCNYKNYTYEIIEKKMNSMLINQAMLNPIQNEGKNKMKTRNDINCENCPVCDFIKHSLCENCEEYRFKGNADDFVTTSGKWNCGCRFQKFKKNKNNEGGETNDTY